MKTTTKMKTFSSLVCSSATYWVEIWSLDRNLTGRENALENNVWRCYEVTLLGHVRTDVIRERLQVEKIVVDRMEEKQLFLYGHMQNMDDKRLQKLCVLIGSPLREVFGGK